MFFALDTDPILQTEDFAGRQSAERAVVPEWQLLPYNRASKALEPLLQFLGFMLSRVVHDGKSFQTFFDLRFCNAISPRRAAKL